VRRLIECVPNFSEGRDAAVVEEIVGAIQSVEGVAVLDVEMDADHNRSVVTFAAPVEGVGEAALRGVERAAQRIDLNRHSGAHPRIGAADVVPFVPLEGVEMAECVAVAYWAGEEIWRRLRIPVYYYEAAARMPERVNLEKIRRGQFEGLREEVRSDPKRCPDVGEADLHPTAGATVVGARKFLIAYNINLSTPEVAVAQRIAKRVRASSGGMPFVKAMGVELKERGLAQVSMNLTDFEQTPLHAVFEAVGREAEKEGTSIQSSEIVGLIPRKALEAAATYFVKAENFRPGLVLENRLAEAMTGSAGEGLKQFLDRVAAPTATPGGGSAAAAAAALAASLGAMVAGLAAGKKGAAVAELEPLAAGFRQTREFFEKAVWRDAASYEAVRAAYRRPKEQRAGPLEAALQGAASAPLEVAEAVQALEASLGQLRRVAPAAMSSDLETAAALAAAAMRGARANVEVNLAEIRDQDFRRDAERRLSRVSR